MSMNNIVCKKNDYARFRNDSGKGCHYKANIGTTSLPIYSKDTFKYAAYAINYAKAARKVQKQVIALTCVTIGSIIAAIIAAIV